MDIHKNARLTPLGRERLVRLIESGHTPKAVAEAVGVCPRTVRKWVERFRAEGAAGLGDRSSRPRRLYRPTPRALVERTEALRRHAGPHRAFSASSFKLMRDRKPFGQALPGGG